MLKNLLLSFLRTYLVALIMIFFGSSFNVQASDCSILIANFVGHESSTPIRFFIKKAEEEQISNADYLEMQKTIDNINKFSSGLAAPSLLFINLSLKHNTPTAYFQNAKIDIGLQYFLQDPLTEEIHLKHPKHTKAILAHEYGHILFSYNHFSSGYYIPEQNDLYEGLRSMRNKLDFSLDELQVLVKRINEEEGILQNGKLNLEEYLLKQRLENLKILQFNYLTKYLSLKEMKRKYKTILSPYEELFADIVSLLLTEDPKGISDSLFFEALFEKSTDAKILKAQNAARDFSNKVIDQDSIDSHGFFSMVRSHLWSSYLSSPKIMRKKNIILPVLFKAISKMASETLSRPSVKMKTEWLEMNNNLIKAIDDEMFEVGIHPIQ